MGELRYIKLGKEKVKDIESDFDFYYEKYEEKAKEKGYKEIKFISEKKNVLIYAVVEI